MAFVSIITPCYNVAANIGKLLNSLQKQTFQDWEFVCVDDGSTDATWEALQRLTQGEPRMKIHRLVTNTGSAKIPRDTAARLSTAPWLCNIDADDWVEDDYLEKLIHRQQETGAELICPTVVCTDATGRERYSVLPRPGFDLSKEYQGEEAVSLALIQWQVPMCGILIPKKVWCGTDLFLNSSLAHANADEFASRIFLSMVNKMACSRATYFYYQNPDSITHAKSRAAELFLTDILVKDYVTQKYGKDSRAAQAARTAYALGLFRAARQVARNNTVSTEVMDKIKSGLESCNYGFLFSLRLPLLKKLRMMVRRQIYRKKFLL